MAGNQIVLTFAGEDRDLRDSFKRVGESSRTMGDEVKRSSKSFDDAGTSVGKFKAGVEEAGRLAVPAAATSAALLGAAVAPALAAALAGGVVLALGGGVLVAGIIAAAKDSKVTGAFGDLKANAQKAFTGFGKPFIKPLVDGISFISGKLSGWADLIQPAADKLAPVISALAQGFGGLVDNALPAIAGAAESAAPAFQTIAGFLPTIGTWMGTFVTKMAELFEWGVKNKDSIGKWISVLLPIAGIFLGIIGVIKVWIGVQELLNIVMSLNPIGLIIIAVAALIGIVIVIATKTTWFQTLWKKAWGGIKSAASAVWDWLKKVPGWIGTAFGKVAGYITAPFRSAFNFVADAWNNTIGRLSFTFPSWVPGIGGNTISVPNLPHFHSGGFVGGTPGSEQLAVLQAGERVLPATSAGAGGEQWIRVDLGDLGAALLEPIARAVQRRGGSVTALGVRVVNGTVR